MPYTAIDNNAIKVRVKKIIDTEIKLVDTANPKDKLRTVLVGTPPNNNFKDLNHPALVITNSERWMEEEHRGPEKDRAITSISTIVRYDLILTVQKDDSIDAEKEVDRLFKLIEERLYQFTNLQKPADGLDPLCNSILLETTRRIPQLQGQEIDGFRSTLKVTIYPHD